MWENRALPWQGRVKQLVRQASPLHQSSDLDKTRQKDFISEDNLRMTVCLLNIGVLHTEGKYHKSQHHFIWVPTCDEQLCCYKPNLRQSLQ